MGSFIGIDLGTTFSVLARIDETGRSIVVRNSDNENIMPSCVEVDKDSEKIIVGTEARKAFADPKIGKGNAAGHFKREMGTSKVYTLAGQRFTPTDLSALVLKKLINDAMPPLDDIEEAVVTVPASFANDAREATIQAAKKAGLNLRFIINEPTAAALYYSYHENMNLRGIYAVYDLGGGTFDISIIRVEGHEVKVLCSNGVLTLGGMDFDKKLQKLVATKSKAVFNDEQLAEVYNSLEAEQDKKSLSKRDKVKTGYEGPGKVIEVTRQEFEEAISEMVAQTEMLCECAVEEAGLKISDIREVLFAGGSTRVPMVQESIKRIFKKDPIFSVNVDEVVALGAAVYAAYKGDQEKLTDAQKAKIGKLNLSDCINSYYGISALTADASGQTKAGNSILIKKNTEKPCSVTKTYYTTHDNQTGVNCVVTECPSDETDLQFTRVKASRTLDLPPDRPAGQAIEVTFSYDVNQIMHCSFTDVETKQKVEIELSFKDQSNHQETDIGKFTVE